MHPFPDAAQRDAGLQHWAQSAVSLDFVPQALSTPKARGHLAIGLFPVGGCSCTRILQDMGDGIPCFGTLKGEVLGPLRGENPPFP